MRPNRAGLGGVRQRAPQTWQGRPLTLIHTNKVPNPMPMRVSAGFDLSGRGQFLAWLDGFCKGVAHAKSTR